MDSEENEFVCKEEERGSYRCHHKKLDTSKTGQKQENNYSENEKNDFSSLIANVEGKKSKISMPENALKLITIYIYEKLSANFSDNHIIASLLDKKVIYSIFSSHKKSFNSIIRKIDDSEVHLVNYFSDLIEIVKHLKKLNDNSNNSKISREISLTEIANKLIQKENTLGYSERTFRYSILKKVFDSLSTLDEFSLKRIIKDTNNFIGDNKRECVRCHRILPNNQFRIIDKRINKRGSICTKCENELVPIRHNRIKLRLIIDIFGLENVKCFDPYCEMKAKIKLLPTLEFQHKYPKKKDFNISKLIGKLSYEKLYNLVLKNKENIIILCRNCHNRFHATLYLKYENLIIDKRIFDKESWEIRDLLTNNVHPNDRTEIKKWLRKRDILEQLFMGKCIGCGKITVLNNLPSLILHHLIRALKSKVDNRIYYRENYEEIINLIKSEKCVSLCHNCHAMVEAIIFEKYNKEIFKKEGVKNFNAISDNTESYYNMIKNNINGFGYEYKKIIDHLTLPFKPYHGEVWKNYLLHCYFLSDVRKKGFTLEELKNSIGLTWIHSTGDSPLAPIN